MARTEHLAPLTWRASACIAATESYGVMLGREILRAFEETHTGDFGGAVGLTRGGILEPSSERIFVVKNM